MPPPDPLADPVLIGRAQLGDLRALDRLLAAAQGPLHRHVAALLGDAHAADDVLQEVLLTVARRLGDVRDPRWFRAWAYRVATRRALRHARRERRQPEATDPHAMPEPEADAEAERLDAETAAALRAALDAAPPASRVVLRLHYLEGLTHVEVAEALELPVGTVKSRLAYGLAWLRQAMAARA